MASIRCAVRFAIAIFALGFGIAAVVLFLMFDAATAAFLLLAALIISLCAASTTLLGAYTRNKAIARQRSEDDAGNANDREPPSA